MFGVYVLERLFDTASAASLPLSPAAFQIAHACRETASRLETRRGRPVIALRRVIGAVAFLVYLRLHGTALLERQLQGC